MRQMDVTMKKIGDTKFYITPFPAFTTARISGELSAVLAPMLGSLAPLFNGGGDAEDVMDTDIEALLPVLSDALSKLSGDDFEHLAKSLLVDYKNIAYDTGDGDTERLTYDAANEIFCANIADMILLGVEVVRINFKGFFRKLAGQFGGLQGAMGNTVSKIGTKNGATST